MGYKYAVGTIHPTKYHGDITIIEYIDKRYRLVRFNETGSVKKVRVCNINAGFILDPTHKRYHELRHNAIRDSKGRFIPVNLLSKEPLID